MAKLKYSELEEKAKSVMIANGLNECVATDDGNVFFKTNESYAKAHNLKVYTFKLESENEETDNVETENSENDNVNTENEQPENSEADNVNTEKKTKKK